MAQTQPLVLVFEDIHWAEEPLLELIEHLTDWVREGPLMILCLARPELLDVRSNWGGGRVRSTSIELEPLAPEESDQLVTALTADGAISAKTRRTLLDKTGGNPLFLEETMRMVAECGEEDAGRIPDTLQALIAARVDRLPADSKTMLQRASVIGRNFWGGAIAHLAAELDSVDNALDDLVLRDFIVAEPRSSLSGETAYRFKHVLIRDVAYTGLSKSARAGYHARFAEWLREKAGEELLEIRAYHLDQAASLLAELDGAPPADLAREAAETLEEAGRRALAREANEVARNSFLRAVELESTLERRYLAAKAARRLWDMPTVAREMEQVLAEAVDAGDRRIQGRALTALAEVTLQRDADMPRARELADQALAVLDTSDPAARLDALLARMWPAWWTGDLNDAKRYASEGLALAQEMGRKDLEALALEHLANVHRAKLEFAEAEDLLRRAMELAEESGAIGARAWVYLTWTRIYLLRGHLEQAEASAEDAKRLFLEAGAEAGVARAANLGAWIACGNGDLERAEKLFRDSIRLLKPLGDRATLCESQRGLAELLLKRGRVDEAERLALEARETVGLQDITSIATTTSALGQVRAAQGRDDEAEELLRAAVDQVAGTDFAEVEYETLTPLAQFLRDRGREDEAAPFEDRREELFTAAKSSARIA